jgi:hypothetical protein
MERSILFSALFIRKNICFTLIKKYIVFTKLSFTIISNLHRNYSIILKNGTINEEYFRNNSI